MENPEKLATQGTQNEEKQNNNTGYTKRRKTKQQHNTVCVGHHYTQTNTNNINNINKTMNKQTTRGKDEPKKVTCYLIVKLFKDFIIVC